MVNLIPLFTIIGFAVSVLLGLVIWLTSRHAMRARSGFGEFSAENQASVVVLTVESSIDESGPREPKKVPRGLSRRARAAKFDAGKVTLLGFNGQFFPLAEYETEGAIVKVDRLRSRGIELNSIELIFPEGRHVSRISLAPDRVDRFSSPPQRSLEELAEAIRLGI